MISPEILRRYSLFAGLNHGAIKDLAMSGQEVTLAAGEWLFDAGDEADALYLIRSGTVDLKLALDQSHTAYADVATLVEGDTLGWSAPVEPHVYQLGAVAATDARLVKLDGARLRELMDRDPTLGYTLMSRLAQVIATRLHHLHVRFVSLVEA